MDWKMYWEGVKSTRTSIRNMYIPVASAIVAVFFTYENCD